MFTAVTPHLLYVQFWKKDGASVYEEKSTPINVLNVIAK